MIVEILTTYWESFLTFLPSLTAAIVLLLIGLIVGKIIGRITKEVLVRAKVDQYVTRRRRPLFRISNIFPMIFRWSIYFLFMWAAVGTLGIPALTEAMQAIVLNFLPGLIKAVIVIVVGYGAAEYLRKQIEASRLAYSSIMANILFWLTIYVSIAIALPLLGIEPTLVNNILLIVVGSFGAGMAIAIGLGLKDTIADMAKRYRRKRR
jgi:small-conductance mechanosensitive channel